MITCTKAAHEERDVATIDITGAYLNADIYEHVIMLIQGMLADLMAMIDPNLYIKFVIINIKRESMFYIKIQKAIYDFHRSVLLFYNIRV